MAGTHRVDIVVVGGGLVGLATARALVRAGAGTIRVIEAEPRLAAHQSGRNSGVVHAGLYYEPGSLKARLCAEGRERLVAFCAEHDVPVRRCGKLVVARDDDEARRLDALRERGAANGLDGLRMLAADEIPAYEPHARGAAALHVPQTAVVDFSRVARAIGDELRASGVEVANGVRVHRAAATAGGVRLETSAGAIESGLLVACAGLHADRVARASGVDPGVRIVPFRGAYATIVPGRAHLVRGLVYPVPDPRFPFLGVHLTRTIDDTVEVGPTAVLALARHGYRRRDVSAREVLGLLGHRGFRRFARRHAAYGTSEWVRSLSLRATVRAARSLVPALRAGDLRPGRSGVRAQAIDDDGRLVDDFHLVRGPRMVHVLNAPSPAATACLAIGAHVADLVLSQA